jgi:hypothetical protein
MKFEDFGVKDETELEQDDFSLPRPTFGKDNQLTVIGWKGRVGGNKYYIVKCSECAKDPELHGDGIFKTSSKRNLINGSYPCGCSNCVRWSKTQYKILIERKCKEKDYVFHGFAEDFKGDKTKLKLECQKHEIWESARVGHLLYNSIGCPKCRNDSNSKPDSFYIDKFTDLKIFKNGMKFWKSERVNSEGYRVYWNYTCPICSNDEYVKEGLCSGIFEGYVGHILRSKLACRCASNYSWTQEQYEYRIKKKMRESETTDEFVGLKEPFKGSATKFCRVCKKHGPYFTGINAYLLKNHGCHECSNQNQQECYINFVKNKDSIIALKFGIAKDSEQRIKNQNRKSCFSIEQHGVWSFPDVKSCKAAERYIKKHLKCRILTKEEMPDGYTETTSIENLGAIIKIYEMFSGVRKSIGG